MSDEVRVDTEELRRLGAAFQEHADELGRALTRFRRRADGEALGARLGTGPEAGRQAELFAEAERVLAALQQRLGEVGHGLTETARGQQDTEDELVASLTRAEAIREAQ
ncbi:hypothetical protein ACFV3R_04790 [Streptomyces sp. NPDC059740]|uniref:hypothetical protein n=1 Tax=Streptomyces sp. NPDC059740 TaxID=3346926 RepID=UPI00364B022C